MEKPPMFETLVAGQGIEENTEIGSSHLQAKEEMKDGIVSGKKSQNDISFY